MTIRGVSDRSPRRRSARVHVPVGYRDYYTGTYSGPELGNGLMDYILQAVIADEGSLGSERDCEEGEEEDN